MQRALLDLQKVNLADLRGKKLFVAVEIRTNKVLDKDSDINELKNRVKDKKVVYIKT